MALHTAAAAIRNGECDAAVVAGVNLLLNPLVSLQMERLGTLSPEGKCKAFDASGRHKHGELVNANFELNTLNLN
jgi:acyl transferase domain-containing protein